MPFIVYEQDHFIRLDIIDMLSTAFPGSTVKTLCKIEDLAETLGRALEPVIAVICANLAELSEHVRAIDAKHALVIVSDQAATGFEAAGFWKTVQRPFTDATLIAAVNCALSNQPSPLK